MLAGSGYTDIATTGTEAMKNWNTQRQRLGKANPISKAEMQKLVQASTVVVTKLPMMVEEETETDRMWKLINEMKARGV
jgi:hypothetical protein